MEDQMKTRSWQRGFMFFGVLGVAVMAVVRGILAVLVVPKIILGVLGMTVMVAIRVILALFVAPKLISRPDAALEIKAKQDIASLMQALKLYQLDNQRYPVTEQGLQALAILPTTAPFPPHWKAGGYIELLPKDPWGNPYQYLSPGVRGEVDIFSLGADDVPGGEGNDTDIRLLVNQG
jgi:general secretion pathway protein G